MTGHVKNIEGGNLESTAVNEGGRRGGVLGGQNLLYLGN